MRKLMSFTFAILLSTGLIAATEPVFVASDLLTKTVWTTQNTSTESVIYYDFQQASIVDIISQKKDGSIKWNSAFWSLIKEGNDTYLVIESNKGIESVRFRLSTSAGKVILSNAELSARLSTVEANDFDIVKSDVIGSWKSPFYDLKTGEKASSDTKVRHMWKLGIEFNANGTFVRYIQKGKEANHEVGVWNVSNDGQFIKLHFAKGGDIENIYKKEILNIQDFKRDFMVVKPEANRKRDRSAIEIVDLNKKSA